MDKVRAGAHTVTGARLRLRAVGEAYMAFAREEPGLFDTAFAAAHSEPATTGRADEAMPFNHLQSALNSLVETGVLPPERRPVIEYPVWATVHGMAMLLRGPLEPLGDGDKQTLEAQALDFIGSAVARDAGRAGAGE
jgi:AcrR family transcriptional regulator